MSDAVLEKDMAAYWDRAGKVWVEQQALLDRLYQPIAEAVVEPILHGHCRPNALSCSAARGRLR